MDVRPGQQDTGEDSARGALGSTLRYLREKAGKSLSQLADDTNYDKSYLYRLEAAERISKRPVMEDLDRYYETGDLLVRLWKLARMDAFVDHYKAFMRLESTANVVHMYTPVIPGLLQTESYARVLLSMWPQRNEEELEEQVAARIGRQELLHRNPRPTVRAIIDEAALRRSVADPQTWADQLTHLLFAAAQPSITVQVLRFSAGVVPVPGGSLHLLWQPDGSSVAYLEGSSSGDLLDEQDDILTYRLAYDRIRDMALTPRDSVTFIERILEEHRS
ncbi:helix-turn-helix domain-containing protein [Streptomyces sp. NRRL S-37]|uniref:helix-turn-helix domain-containing protein n=1 Tax=Streptomyces sp. NRRL S-37 TaxID=1463903 RepID=UPI0004CA8E3F|nr:helix-turn-helix transcriptional regulator [Streptomyces sp. NRRL S-37]